MEIIPLSFLRYCNDNYKGNFNPICDFIGLFVSIFIVTNAGNSILLSLVFTVYLIGFTLINYPNFLKLGMSFDKVSTNECTKAVYKCTYKFS